MKKFLIIFFIFFYKVSVSQVRIYSNDFLSVGVGARASAMAGSVTAWGYNSENFYRNSAVLCLSDKKFDLALMHSEYFAGISKYDFISLAFKNSDSVASAFSVIRLGTDDILNTLELVDADGNVDYNRITKFSVADYAFIYSYAFKSKIKNLSGGLNVKFIYRNQGEFAKAYGFGFDISALYLPQKWKFGLTLSDATSTFNAWFFNTDALEQTFLITGNDLPENGLEITAPKLLYGTGREFSFSHKFSLYSEIDLDFTFDGKRNVLVSGNFINIEPHLGFEFNYSGLFFLRFGLGNLAVIESFDKKVFNFMPSAGLGILYKNFRIDYALTNIGNVDISPYSNYISLGFSFDKISGIKKNRRL